MRRSFAALLFVFAFPLFADLQTDVDKTVTEVLRTTGAPSASVAIVQDGAIAFTRAYGWASLEPRIAATADMRYSIGSISKQFTAAAVLLLAEEGKLSLDDRVVRWLPELTRAKDVSIRQLLSMTSGYQDFWPQDYVMPGMLEPVTAQEILDNWGRKPLDFEPGTRWQYSNTNYVIAGVIVEKVAGMPLLDFLRARVFGPLGMTSVVDTDSAPLAAGEPMRYRRYALGPVRVAPKEGKGWMFAAGELAMTARDLAKWNVALMNRAVLTADSYRELEREVQLANGLGSRYALGLTVGSTSGRRFVSHGGEVSGFTAHNLVYPEDRVAVTVLTNLDASNASEQIATRIATILLATADSGTAAATAQAQTIFEGLQRGTIDRTLFTSNANAYFDQQALKDFSASLGPLGKVQEFKQVAQSLRGGMTLRRYTAKLKDRSLRVWTFTMPDGKLEQYLVAE